MKKQLVIGFFAVLCMALHFLLIELFIGFGNGDFVYEILTVVVTFCLGVLAQKKQVSYNTIVNVTSIAFGVVLAVIITISVIQFDGIVSALYCIVLAMAMSLFFVIALIGVVIGKLFTQRISLSGGCVFCFGIYVCNQIIKYYKAGTEYQEER